MNPFGRIAVCGLISGYDGNAPLVKNPLMLVLGKVALDVSQ